MARSILRMGHPTLLRKAETIQDIDSDTTKEVIQDMLNVVNKLEKFSGLAAPQIGHSYQIFLFQIGKTPTNPLYKMTPEYDPEGVPLTILLNPCFKPLSDEIEEGYEGCLSLPGLVGMVPRFKHIQYDGIDPEGKVVSRKASGFHARVFQHEYDHLQGILYPMRMTDLSTLSFADEALKNLKK